MGRDVLHAGGRSRYHYIDENGEPLCRASGEYRRVDLAVFNGHKMPCRRCRGLSQRAPESPTPDRAEPGADVDRVKQALSPGLLPDTVIVGASDAAMTFHAPDPDNPERPVCHVAANGYERLPLDVAAESYNACRQCFERATQLVESTGKAD
jgi:hypothetical protein